MLDYYGVAFVMVNEKGEKGCYEPTLPQHLGDTKAIPDLLSPTVGMLQVFIGVVHYKAGCMM